MNELIISLILALIGALGAWVTKNLIPYIKSKTTAEQRKTLLSLVSTAVAAAEQMPVFRDRKGEDKKEYVRQWLRERGIVLSDELDAMIESAVYALKNGGA